MNNTPKLSIVLPCYNESDNIPHILACFREAIQARDDIEIILVNNGSTDDSEQILAEETKKSSNSFVRVVKVEVNQGYGFGIMTGIKQAKSEVISWTHADMQTDPKDVIGGYEKFSAQPDIRKAFLKGKRIKRNFIDVFFTFGMSVISSLALGQRVSDINAQPKMFHRSFLEYMNEPPDDFSLDLYVLYLAKKQGMLILEQPVYFAKRRSGQAKGGGTFKGKIKLIKRTWMYITNLRKTIKQENR